MSSARFQSCLNAVRVIRSGQVSLTASGFVWTALAYIEGLASMLGLCFFPALIVFDKMLSKF